MRPAHQRPRWRCKDPQCPQHEWQHIVGDDPLHTAQRFIDQHLSVDHADGDPHCVLEMSNE